MSSLPITLGTLLLLFSVYSTSVEGNCRPGPPGPRVAGATYVRWGRTSCPTELGTQLLYAGRAAGPHHYHQGGGANLLCLPDVPDYLHTVYTVQNHASLYGVEYQLPRWWSLPGPTAQHHGQRSTLGILERTTEIIIGFNLSVLTKILNWWRERRGMWMVCWFTFLKPPATLVWTALPTMLEKNSPVQYVPSEHCNNYIHW